MNDRQDADRTAADDVVETVGELAGETEERIASVAAAGEAGIRQARASLRERSDETLGLLGAFSVGLSTGLLLAGMNRLLTVAALIPAALIATVMLDRADDDPGQTHPAAHES